MQRSWPPSQFDPSLMSCPKDTLCQTFSNYPVLRRVRRVTTGSAKRIQIGNSCMRYRCDDNKRITPPDDEKRIGKFLLTKFFGANSTND